MLGLHLLVFGLEVLECIAGLFREVVAVHAIVWIIRCFKEPEHIRIRGLASTIIINYGLVGTNDVVAGSYFVVERHWLCC